MTKEIVIEGKITCFEYDGVLGEWTATFTLSELRSFIKHIKQRAKDKKVGVLGEK